MLKKKEQKKSRVTADYIRRRNKIGMSKIANSPFKRFSPYTEGLILHP